jgi:hypothetical protein
MTDERNTSSELLVRLNGAFADMRTELLGYVDRSNRQTLAFLRSLDEIRDGER